MKRRPLVIGNWKLNGNKYLISRLIAQLTTKLSNQIDCEVVIAPPIIYLYLAKHHLTGSKIVLSAQNVDINLSGAFTGETSAEMLKDIGIKYTIIGHSERRSYHQENDEYIAKKFALLKETGIIPVLCIGESQSEKVLGRTNIVCTRQLDVVLNNLGIKAFENTVIAYEPIWAIGTGKSATPQEAQTVHQFIRSHIALYDSKVAANVIILYGGSVNNVDNVTALLSQPDIDGVLVGGASIKADLFALIVEAAATIKSQHATY